MSTRFNPYFGWCVLSAYNDICMGLDLVDVLEDVFHLCMDVATHAVAIVFDQTHVVSLYW